MKRCAARGWREADFAWGEVYILTQGSYVHVSMKRSESFLSSIDRSAHNILEFLIGDLLVVDFASPLKHKVKHLLIIVLVQLLAHILQIAEGYVPFAFSIVLLENMLDIPVFIFLVWLRMHGSHELSK
jgi:hypothetical protein